MQIAPTKANAAHGNASGVKIEHLDVHVFDLHTTPLQAHTMNGEAFNATNVLLPRNSMDLHVNKLYPWNQTQWMGMLKVKKTQLCKQSRKVGLRL
jgi:hypothetical protein